MSLFGTLFGNTISSQAASNKLAGYPRYGASTVEQPRWVYNNKDCTLEEFAKQVWPDDEHSQLVFILKHGGIQ
jgi:hypothetical protein